MLQLLMLILLLLLLLLLMLLLLLKLLLLLLLLLPLKANTHPLIYPPYRYQLHRLHINLQITTPNPN